MTPEQKQRIEQIRERMGRYKLEPYAPDLWWDDTNFLLSLVKEQEAGDTVLCEGDIKTAIFKVISESDQWLFYHPKEGQSQRADFVNQVISLLRRNQLEGELERAGGLGPLLRLRELISKIALVADTGSASEFGDAIERLRLISEMTQFDDKAGTTRAQSDLNDATSMRSACVEKVKVLRDEWEAKRNTSEPLSKLRNRYDAAFCAANEILTQLESLSIEKPKE